MPDLNPFQPEISALLIALKQNAHDPVAFAALRERILALHLGAARTEDLGKIQHFQDQIEGQVAINGFNQASVELLLGQLMDSAELLRVLVLSIENPPLQGISKDS